MNKQELIELVRKTAFYIEPKAKHLVTVNLKELEHAFDKYLQSQPQNKSAEEKKSIIRQLYAKRGIEIQVDDIEFEVMQEYAQQDIEYNKIQNQFKVIEAIQEYNQQDIELPSETDKNRLTREYRYNRKINDIESEWYQDFRNGFDSAIKAIEQLIKNK